MLDSIRARLPSAESSPEVLAQQQVQTNNKFANSTISTSNPQSQPVIQPNALVRIGNFILGLLYKAFACFRGLFNPSSSTGAKAIQAINNVEKQVDKVAPKIQPEILISGGKDDEERKANFIRMIQRDGYAEVMNIEYPNTNLAFGGFVELIKNRVASMGNEPKAIVAFAPTVAFDWVKVISRISSRGQFPEFQFGKTEQWTNEKGENRHALHIVKKGTPL